MITVQIFTPNDPEDIRAHRWRGLVCFKGKCEKPLRTTDMQSMANDKIVEAYGVIGTRTYCLPHLFEQILLETGSGVPGQLV